MLILTRKIGETLMIGDEVTVTVLGNKGNQVRLGIAAPDDTLSSSLVSDTSDKIIKLYFEKNLPVIPSPREERRNIDKNSATGSTGYKIDLARATSQSSEQQYTKFPT